MTSVVLAAVVPVVAVWSVVEAVRTAPRALANLRSRRRLSMVATPVLEPTPTALRMPRSPGPIARSLEVRRRRARDRAVPERLDRIVRRLRTGATLPIAIVGVGTDDEVLAPLASDIGAGVPLAAAVTRWRDAESTPNRRLAAVALELTADAGGASARVLDGVAESLRDRVALDREVAALSSQSRASAALLVLAPLVFAALAGAVEPRILSTLFGTPIGWACLIGGGVLDVVGATWMARLVGRHR